jgi:nicotinamidase-related amidase
VPALARRVPPAIVVDKPAYSAFFQSKLYDLLARKEVRTIVVSGAETDVCCLPLCSAPSISASGL